MSRVFVLDKNKKALMPCCEARARKLLSKGKAKVYRRCPFTIILTCREGGETQPIEFKVDPGSKATGIALVGQFAKGFEVIWGRNLYHRGAKISQSLKKRRAIRRSRRNRKTRYRKPRFANRRRKQGRLFPSLQSRVDNIWHWAFKLDRLAPITTVAVETVRFDTQKIQNPEISGVMYQQGELFGYEVKEYLLEKWGRKCAYCDREGVPLQIEHIVPKSRGGSDRISNLTLACRECNQKKGNRSVEEFLKKDIERLARIVAVSKTPLKDAAAVNSIRFAIWERLKSFGKPTTYASGGRTKFNRLKQDYVKDHWIDAACVGETGEHVKIPLHFKAGQICATGRGTRQVCRVDKYGFPRTSAKTDKKVFGFQTGDIVKAVVPTGKKRGTYCGKVAVRSSGFFNIQTRDKTIEGINHKFCRLVHRRDGYTYA